MSDTAMPCFVHFPTVGNLVGRLLAGYGELEVEMCFCLSETMNGDVDAAIRLLFSRMPAEARHNLAKKSMRDAFAGAELTTEFRETMAAMTWCRKIRNQYAHCQWYYTHTDGVAIIDLEEIAKKPDDLGPLAIHRKYINEPLLVQQDGYFLYVRRLFLSLAEAYKRFRDADKMTKRQRVQPPTFPRPKKVNQPKLHL